MADTIEIITVQEVDETIEVLRESIIIEIFEEDPITVIRDPEE